MSIVIRPDLEARLRQKADAAGVSVEVYVEMLVRSDQEAEEELESLALEGLNSGDAIAVGPEYWAEKHRRLDQRLRATGAQ